MEVPTFIGVYDNLVPDKFCDRVVETHQELEKSSSLGGHSADEGEKRYGGPSHRRDTSFYFNIDAPEIATEVNQFLDVALNQYTTEYPSAGMRAMYSQTVKVQRTPPKGGFHSWHAERGRDNSSNLREVVWMIYLNDTPEGEGTTEFIEQGMVLQPKKGTVVLFPSAWTHTHRGNPVYSHDKYIATGWYYLMENI